MGASTTFSSNEAIEGFPSVAMLLAVARSDAARRRSSTFLEAGFDGAWNRVRTSRVLCYMVVDLVSPYQHRSYMSWSLTNRNIVDREMSVGEMDDVTDGLCMHRCAKTYFCLFYTVHHSIGPRRS